MIQYAGLTGGKFLPSYHEQLYQKCFTSKRRRYEEERVGGTRKCMEIIMVVSGISNIIKEAVRETSFWEVHGRRRPV